MEIKRPDYSNFMRQTVNHTLRELLEKGPVLAPCVYDGFSAKVVEQIGFQAMCLSGGNLAMSLLGVPDIGLVSFGDGHTTEPWQTLLRSIRPIIQTLFQYLHLSWFQ